MPEIRDLVQLPDGKFIRGYEIEFELVKDTWTEYRLSDGTSVRTKHVLSKAFRLVDEDNKPLFDDFGEPQVVINGAVVVSTSKAPTATESKK